MNKRVRAARHYPLSSSHTSAHTKHTVRSNTLEIMLSVAKLCAIALSCVVNAETMSFRRNLANTPAYGILSYFTDSACTVTNNSKFLYGLGVCVQSKIISIF